MKVVVVKSPKLLGGILRKIFGIQKTEIQWKNLPQKGGLIVL